jgi:hypothetical protein
MSADRFQEYLRKQQMSLQWLPVLRGMAQEMATLAGARELRLLFFRIGERFAADAEERFRGADSLPRLEASLNELWGQIDWGWADLVEEKGHVSILHHAAPLAEAFGDEALPWTVGLLEGFYHSVFKLLGASDRMAVRCAENVTDGMNISLRFARADK